MDEILLFAFLRIWQKQIDSLKELQDQIDARITEVKSKVTSLNEAIVEWHVATHTLSNECQYTTKDNAEKYHVWHQNAPLLNSFLSAESKVHNTIYTAAQIVGMLDELDAQTDVKELLLVCVYSKSTEW